MTDHVALIETVHSTNGIFELFAAVRIPEAGDNGDVPEKLRAAEALNPVEQFGILLIQASSRTADDEKHTDNLNKRAESHEATGDIAKRVDVFRARVAKTSRVDKEILLVINDGRTHLVVFGSYSETWY